MDEEIELRQSDAFVLKILAGEGPDLTGQVENVRTGAKRRFRGLEELGRAIARLRRGDNTA